MGSHINMIKDRSQTVWKLFNQKDHLTLDDFVYKQWVFRYTFLELEKDLGEYGDITTDGLIKKGKKARARIYANQEGIMACASEIKYFIEESDPKFRPRLNTLKIEKCFEDGDLFNKDDVVIELSGDVTDILKVERTILNLLQHTCGIALNAKKIIDLAKKENPDICIVPTRKTTWGLLDKKAVVVAGGGTHRLNLSDAVLIKDNHLALFDHDIKKTLFTFHPPTSPYTFFEIEIDDADKIIETARMLRELQKQKALTTFAVIMFDNIKPEDIEKQIDALKKEKLYDYFLYEASGGITQNNILKYAKTAVDVISLGALTQKIEPTDLSLEIGTENMKS